MAQKLHASSLYLSKPYSTYQRVCQNSETLVIFLKQEKKKPDKQIIV
jgi:hypothetical protein